MRTTFNISFYCRKSKADRNGMAPIELGICINGVRKFINLPRKCEPKIFGYKRKPKELADYLSLMRSRINQICTEMLANGEPITTDSVREYVRFGGYKSYSVGDMVNGFLALKQKDLNNGVITNGQYVKYVNTAKLLYGYVAENKEVTNITPALMQTIYADLKGKYKNETMCGYMTRLKSFVKYALDNGKLTVNPMSGLKIIKDRKPVEVLPEADFNKILAFHSDIERLMKVRDIFLFACGSGLGYIDICNLTPADFKTVDGVRCIIKKRHKTNVEFVAVLLPCALHIAEKHNYDLRALMISNQRLNSYLKEIQDLCKIKSVASLHFYLGRHYYANHLLNSGVRAEIVSKALGHSSYKILLRNYATVEHKTTVSEIAKII